MSVAVVWQFVEGDVYQTEVEAQCRVGFDDAEALCAVCLGVWYEHFYAVACVHVLHGKFPSGNQAVVVESRTEDAISIGLDIGGRVHGCAVI